MRIDPITAAPIKSIASPSAVGEDKLSSVDHASEGLTNDTADIDQVTCLVAKATEQPEIRMDKVQAIKSQIASGTYELNPSKIADALVSSGEI